MCAILQEIKEGDEVIMPSYTFVSTSNAYILRGAKIIFADSAKEQFSICPIDVKKKITKKTKMIILTHLYGRPADMDPLLDICKKKKIFLIEDCSQAAGAIYKNRMVGSIGDFNIHSFHNKLIASGEGGMITTDNKMLAERFENLKNPPAVNRPEERNNFKA
jgi:dTDP-4-amino-4,6-dideoxygalactose transaminase